MIFQRDLNSIEATEEEKALRQNEFSHLKDICYIDYTGAGICSQSQLDAISNHLRTSVLSHPHGSSVLSHLCVSEIDQTRDRILDFFDTDSNDYSVIFTSGATAAIKIVSECFHFNKGSFVYLTDNHTSVLGMRDVVGTDSIYHLPVDKASEMLNDSTTDHNERVKIKFTSNSLFVYPAQSNFSGRKYPLSWCNTVHTSSALRNVCDSPRSNWFVLLDAATHCASSKLSLKHSQPDFVCISFYKMFGYPTGLGALMVKNSSAQVLNKSYYGGGTVKIALANENYHMKKDDLSEKFEDGTVNYLAIVSLRHGFDLRTALWKDYKKVFELAQYTHWYLKHLYYPNRKPAVELYHDNDFSSSDCQGSIVNFNLLRKNGSYYGYSQVQNLANLKKIQLRTGCHCNPGSCQRFLRLSDDTLKYHFEQGHVCGDDKDIIEGKPTGSVRISYGYASNWNDVKYFLFFIKQYFLSETELIPSDTCVEDEIAAMPDPLHRITSVVDDNQINGVKLNSVSKPIGVATIESECVQVETVLEDIDLECRLESMYLYPVKACGYYKVRSSWAVNTSGLLYDRQWMIVNQSGVVLTQKLEKNLCLVRPDFDFKRNVMILCYTKSGSTVEVCLENSESDESYLSLCRSKVCNDRITGYDCGDDVAHWLDSQLDYSGLRLIRLKQRSSKRNLNSLSNMGQYLLIAIPSIQAELDSLKNKFNVSFEIDNFVNRFRSNFVLNGAFESRAENDWNEVIIESDEGLLSFEVKSQCVRCQYIYVDQESGLATDVPLGITKFGIYVNNKFDIENEKKLYLTVGNKVYCKKRNT